jgi:hypothetical protein
MTSRILALCARVPDGAQIIESLGQLGDALDEAAVERLPGGDA